MIGTESRWWDAGSLAVETDLPLPKTRRLLEAFASRNLLDIRISDDVRYRLRAGTPELARALRLVIETYRRTPALVREWAEGIA